MAFNKIWIFTAITAFVQTSKTSAWLKSLGLRTNRMEEIYYKEGSLFLKQLFLESLRGSLFTVQHSPCQQSGHHVLKPRWLQEPGQAGPSPQPYLSFRSFSLTLQLPWGTNPRIADIKYWVEEFPFETTAPSESWRETKAMKGGSQELKCSLKWLRAQSARSCFIISFSHCFFSCNGTYYSSESECVC